MKKLFFFSTILSILQIGCSSWPSYYDEYWNNLYKQFSIPTEEFHNQNYERAKVLLWKYLEADTAIANYEAYAFLSQTYFRLGLVDSGRTVLTNGINRLAKKRKIDLTHTKIIPEEINDMREWLASYPKFPEYLMKENGFVPYDIGPEPVNGMADLTQRLVYPEQARRKKIEGRVIVKASVNEAGEVTSAEIFKSLSLECDAEAMSVVLDTQFVPGRKKGRLVKVTVLIPILFKLS